ncbi:MAG: M48 family metalloprotease [Vulcanimicrobiaceae bacterium]
MHWAGATPGIAWARMFLAASRRKVCALHRFEVSMPFRRIVPLGLIVALLCASIPAPAEAMSTASEIQQAKQDDKQVMNQYNVVTDPLLNRWVNDVGNNLWAQTARKDVPYNIKILDTQDINSFTIGGGYIYVNEGLVDFVQSEDELAGVLGHETGHNERRHTVTLPAKAQILNLLFGVASIFSPIVYNFGGFAEAGIIAKAQRSDELQADQYGLLLMSRAGYDPDSMVSFMNHLGVLEGSKSSLVDAYLADHPGFRNRVAHLEGYPELDPTKRTTDQILVQALHDQAEGRYSIASMKLAQVLKADPTNPSALLHLGQTQIALGQTEKSQQTLAEAAEKGTPQTRVTALSNIKELRQDQAKFSLTKPNLAPLRQEMADAQSRETLAVATLAVRHDAGRDQAKAVKARIQDITYGVPDLSRVQIRPGSRLEAITKNFNAMAKAIDASFNKSEEAIDTIGSLEKNKESGLVKENADILKGMSATLAADPVPAQSLALLPSYPRMLDDIALTDGDMIRSLDAARGSLAMLDVSLGALNDFIEHLSRSQLDMSGDISLVDYNALVPIMQKAMDGLSRAAIAGSQSQQLYNLARARQLQTRITLTGVGYPEDRYATLQSALEALVKNDGLDYTAMEHDDLTPGEVATASIVAADTNTTPQAVVREAVATKRSLVDVANARGMHSEALEIFLGLVYLDYTDDPVQEAKGNH